MLCGGIRVVLETRPFQGHSCKIAVVLCVCHNALGEQFAGFLNSARLFLVRDGPLDFLDQVRKIWFDWDIVLVWQNPVVEIFLKDG